MVKKGNDKFTISVNRKIKDDFKRYCDKEGLQPSRQIEKFMELILRGQK
jgi:hypothetical protein